MGLWPNVIFGIEADIDWQEDALTIGADSVFGSEDELKHNPGDDIRIDESPVYMQVVMRPALAAALF